MSSYSATSHSSLNGQVTEKLSRTNYVLWRTQITPRLRGGGLFGYADGAMTVLCAMGDQQVLGFLLSNLSKEVLVTVTAITTAHALWTALAGMFSSQSLSRVNNIRTALINAQKGNQSVTAYFAYMRGLADELASAGKAIQDDEMISYIIHGLDMDY